MKNNIYKIGVKKAARRMALGCLLLFAFAGSLVAQNDRQYVIWYDGHFLSHAGNTIQDATSFSPDCLWYSSNNYNYYFMNGTTRMYLKAPLEKNGTITCTADPGTSILNNITLDYFFYDWDHGLARGLQHFGGTCPPEYNSSGGECWQAVWVSYENNTWKMSSQYGYDPTAYAAHFLKVTTTVYEEAFTNVSGGVGNLEDFTMGTLNETHALDGTASDYSYTYTPAYTHYYIEGYTDTDPVINILPQNYYYYNNTYTNTNVPGSTSYSDQEPTGYEWTLDAIGQLYLTFQGGNYQIANPTLVYSTQNTETTHQLATLTLTVTYQNGATQTRTATVTVRTLCRNPEQASAPVVTYVGVTVSWVATADSYTVSWKKNDTSTTWSSATVDDVTSYTITGLAFNTEYLYKVTTDCGTNTPTEYTFTTKAEPGLMVGGAIFGGGRMANVGGKTEIVVVNCDSIGGIYGGNDIAGEVQGTNGSKITLGVNTSDPNSYDVTYGTTPTGVLLKFGSIYGGGNGYYAYNGTSFVAASSDYTEETVAVGAHVNAMTPAHTVGDVVWTNTSISAKTLEFPKIVKTAITVSNNQIKVDSLFGGAKNAFLTRNSFSGDSIVINGGTILAVFGGNNIGGGQGYGKHYIAVNGTTTNLNPSIENTATHGYGRDFGIRYLFGGGNKVYGSTSDIYINGGQCDTVFAGGNSADLYAANVTVNCAMGDGSGNTWGKVYSNAIDTYSGGVITPKTTYGWDGYAGIYNVRTLFGGNNQATFDSKFYKKVPNITLTSGSIGTVYGGGNAGDMWGRQAGDPVTINGNAVNYGTHVEMNSPTILIDNLYGGCQVSNVHFGTWVEIKEGHVGTVYGGCNVSGDVGSTRTNPGASSGEDYQAVYGGTYVVASGGTIYKNLFAGGNGFYHCVNDDGYYYGTINYTNHNYIGLKAPTHNETHVILQSDGSGVLVKGNVYAGGNLASVGFDNSTVGGSPYPKFVGLASVVMSNGRVNGSVYGGGNMANVYGSNEVQVSGGIIDNSLYGGNDRMGKVAQISNRVLPASYNTASDTQTSLLEPKVYTYVGLTGDPTITNVYGGGNGDYAYFTTFADAQDYIAGGGTKETVVSCDITNQPIQRCTFVDVGVTGGSSGAHIGTVYGGGDGVTVTEFLKVFLNVQGATDYSNVGTIFGGNNKGDLALVSDIILLKGQVDYVYGGCNEGAMTAGGEPSTMVNLKTIGGYTDIGSYVRLLNTYDPDGDGPYTPVAVDAKVTGAIFGGCRKNGVTKNSLVLVEGGNYLNTPIYGGSDISGDVLGFSRVAVTGGTTGNVYGGGNGNYDYSSSGSYSGLTAPTCVNSGVDVLGGQIGATGDGNARNVFGGGYGAATSTSGNVTVNVGPATATSWTGLPVIYGDVYGGSALGSVNTNNSNTTTVNFLNGTLHGNVFGGGLGDAGDADKGKTYGQVLVNISNETQSAANCFIDLRDANVYGCNNTNGSPQDDVTVHVWKTAYTFAGSSTDYTAATGVDPNYAIQNVFGGGKLASYQPTASSNKALVYVHGCSNTISRVFGGGDAAAARHAAVTIEGGRFDQVFGGGNGETTPADVGDGGIDLTVSGGKIRQLFGGNNTSGNIVGPMTVNVTNSGDCTEDITEFFGGSNLASMGTTSNPVELTTTIGCNTEHPVAITNVYGGSNLATITGNVTVTIEGGTFTNVFAGSKGGASAATITGNTTLNLYGGTLTNAFGGSNVNGNITGSITVNVLDYEACPLDVTNIYGASNQTVYEPTDPSLVSPIVNVMHIKQDAGIRGNVFGGGNQGAVTANPKVNIGYDATSMSTLIPTGYPIAEANRRAYVTGSVYGGGNEAGVTSPTVNLFSGTVATNVYGGCNTNGTVTGDIAVNAKGGTVGQDLFGGGQGDATRTNGNVTVTIEGATIGRDVYGGSALGQVNDNATDDLTKVWLKSGTVTGNLYGGGMGQAGQDTWGQVNGKVEVYVNGGTVNNVFGCNNYNEAPEGTVKVYINETSTMTINGNVYGGGNEAAYGGTTEVYIQNGTINNKVFGGGNNITAANAGVGNANVQMTGGTVLDGIFGGCNTDGDVTGNTVVTLTGGTIGAPGLGNGASVHGGGYGHLTSVAGNVTVNFGVDDDLINNNLILYGDLYGGSAMGTVNTDNHNTTTVNVYSGTIEALYIDPAHPENNVYGNVFGGGLGNADHPAAVNGKVVVNIGLESIGKASLVNCNVFGCNNQNGSPQDDVFVNIYQTAHTEKDEAGYLEMDRTYAIYQVFGGGNLAHYAPADSDKKTTVHVYNCDNTSRFVYGGGNAADAVGVVTVIEGGRFDEVYGGGNGRVTAANIGTGGIGLAVLAGNISFLFEGSNKEGDNAGPYYTPGGYSTSCLGGLFVDSYFFGTNEAELYHDLNNIITCAEAGNFEYRYVFAGSRWGIVYGDISLTVCGGIIENLFGGCRGYTDYSADVRRFPTFEELNADYALPEAERKYSQELRDYMGFDPGTYNPAYPHAGEPSYVGHGGNINLIVEGGIIGNVFGGCDIKGNVEGKISVTVCDDGDAECPFFVGNVYGASNQWYHDPENSTINSPDVKILKGTIGGTDVNLPVNNIYGAPATAYEGNVFGGGNLGHVTSNPVVIIGDGTTGSSATPVNVKGNVYGGGNLGDVTGNSQVIVVPQPHSVTYTVSPTGGTITVKNGLDQIVSSGSNVGEGIDLYLMATPDISGYRFVEWTVSNGTVAEPNAAKTVFTMGTGDATISATFEPIASHSLTFSAPTGGSMIVGDNLTSPQTIGVGVVLSLSAIPDVTHKFSNWTVTGTGSSVTSSTSATTNFTMGTENTEIAAVFAPIELEKIHTLTLSTPSNGTYTVTDRLSNPVSNGASIGEGTILNLSASPSANYAFIRWTVSGAGASIANVNNPTTTFTMGTENATITAVFASVHEFTFSQPEHGTVKVTDVLGHVVNSGDKIGEGAMLNLKATPATGYAFQQWTATNGTIPTGTANAPISTFTMGTSNTIATVTATFVTAHTLTITTPENGTIKVTSNLGQNITSGASIGVGAVLELVATPADGYTFTSWTVTGGTLNTSVIPNTFTMGSTDATITATFTVTP